MMHPPITIFCAFTRRWAIELWLDNLKQVQHDPAQTELCFIIDCEETFIQRHLERFAKDNGYKSIHVKMNYGWHPNETRLSIRRQRVAEVHEQAKDLVAQTTAQVIIGLEDDTVFDRMHSFDRLINPILAHDAVGFVEGVQMGRWGANMIGAWRANDIADPTHIETLLPQAVEDQALNDGYESITGGGWYGYATRRDLFLNATYYASTSQPWGPDVNFGFYVNSQSYDCLIDWTTVFGHNDHGTIMYPDDGRVRLARVVFHKSEINGKWDRIDHEPSRY